MIIMISKVIQALCQFAVTVEPQLSELVSQVSFFFHENYLDVIY